MEDSRKGIIVIAMVILGVSLQLIEVESRPQVPCFFIFGDSLSDSGNNNNLLTLAKANFLPYGMDHPNGPTGRFTNGKTTVDLIGDYLGLEDYIPPFSSVKDKEIVKGVNYASGSAGILQETGYQVGMRVSMDQQLINHKTAVLKLAKTLGKNSTTHLKKCIYSVYVGNNDWMLNYFAGGIAFFQGKPQAHSDILISKLSDQLKTLYGLGARKIIVFGIGPLGCLPILNVAGICSNYVNGVLEMYNAKLKSLVDAYNTKFTDAKFIWINTMAIVSPNNLNGLGLQVTNIPCCGVETPVCIPFSIPCVGREKYAYWDHEHPTEAANKVLAKRAYSAIKKTDVYPMGIRNLARLKLKA
ncbi:GDSL esterase/lipase At1g29670-like [Silene latifolia]|uniref:GDSL esterase/lipase At1g29670-like n=1 Tax=Silene latifolia TaxID=37657 RepID=UPI003D76CB9C